MMKNKYKEALVLSSLERRKEALDILLKIPEEFLTPDVYVLRAILMQVVDNDFSLTQIEQEFLSALSIQDDYLEAHYELGVYYDVVLGNPTKGLEHLNIAKKYVQRRLQEIEESISECG